MLTAFVPQSISASSRAGLCMRWQNKALTSASVQSKVVKKIVRDIGVGIVVKCSA